MESILNWTLDVFFFIKRACFIIAALPHLQHLNGKDFTLHFVSFLKKINSFKV